MSKMMKNEQLLSEVRRLDFVDALRGWAFLLVLLTQVDKSLGFSSRIGALLVPGSAYGVQLFFIVSALTLFLSLHLRKADAKGLVGAFFVRRFFRVAPMFWIAALFYLALGGFRTLYGTSQEATAWRVASTFLFLHGWRPDTIHSVVPGGWTIAVQTGFYLFLPLFFKYVTRLKKAVLGLFVSLAFYALANFVYRTWLVPQGCPAEQTALFLRLWLPSQLPVFFLGIILFFLVRDGLDKEGDARRSFGIGGPKADELCAWALFCVAFGFFIWVRPLYADPSFHHLVFGAAFFFLAWAFALHPFPFLINPFTNYVGKISYSAFLCHFFVVDAVAGAFYNLAGRYRWPFWPSRYFIMFYITSLAVTLCVATLTYVCIELPFQKLGKKIIHRWL